MLLVLFEVGRLTLCQWKGEIEHFAATVPVILVGLKQDLRSDPHAVNQLAKCGQKPVVQVEVGTMSIHRYLVHASMAFSQGEATAKEIGAVSYLECSALKGIGVREVFRTATTWGVGTLLKEREERDKEKACIIA